MLARINTWIKMPERIYGCIRRCTVKQANWGSYFPWEITCKNWALHLSVGICGMLLVHQRGPQSRCNAEAAYLQAQTRPALFLISSQARWSPRFFSHGSHLLTLALEGRRQSLDMKSEHHDVRKLLLLISTSTRFHLFLLKLLRWSILVYLPLWARVLEATGLEDGVELQRKSWTKL
jgi:hypothetical protein